MKSNPSFLIISVLIPFLFSAHECNVISRRDADETAQNTEKQLIRSPMINLGEQDLFEGDIMLPGKTPIGGIKPSAVYENRIWPDGTIPYIISDNYSEGQAKLILDAMEAYKIKTCIQFIPRKDEKNYIDIQKTGDGCYSYVGRIGGKQKVSLDDGCLKPKTIRHELMHAAGFYHEQSRTDRDDYVTVNYDNIETGMGRNFNKYDSKAAQLLGTPYDIKSIMHYGWNAFAQDSSKPTLTDKNGNKVGPSDDFTLTDLVDLNRLYKCQKDAYYVDWKAESLNNAVFISAPNCNLITEQPIRSVESKMEECGGLCAADLSCTLFTWNPNGNCALTTGPKLAPVPREEQGAMCGYISEGNSNFQWEDFNGQEKRSKGCDFPGNDISTVDLGETTCFNLCIAEPECTSYAERNDQESGVTKCYLKTGKSPIARTIFTNDGNAYCSMISARI